MKDNKPLIGITMGDPTGIGPEVAVKALNLKEIYSICKPVIIGDAGLIKQICQITKLNLRVNPVARVSEGGYRYGTLDVLDMNNVDVDRLVYKKVSKMAGKASLDYIYKAIDLAINNEIQAVVTGPIHKKAINLAGCPYAGHTEIFAERTHTKDYAMMLVEGNFRVVHVSTHVSLRKACELVKRDRILTVIRLANDAMKGLGIENPRIAVPGFNPHASDEGLFGDEEEKEIIPAIEMAKKEGIQVDGPIPPDSVFVKLKGGRYDVSLAMYHDQGHIPAKLLSWTWDEESQKWTAMRGVNATLGLPIIRTSVDHGVAYGKAGEGRANPQSLIEAIKLAVEFAKRKSYPA